MILYKNQKLAKMKSLNKLKISALKGTVIPLMLLTSCSFPLKEKNTKLNLYQPSTLRLQKDKPIETVDGIYTPQTDEVWHSDARYRKLERENY